MIDSTQALSKGKAPPAGIKQTLEKKEGLFRKHMMVRYNENNIKNKKQKTKNKKTKKKQKNKKQKKQKTKKQKQNKKTKTKQKNKNNLATSPNFLKGVYLFLLRI